MQSQRIVLLGGTGFVGSYLVPRLASDGHHIVLLSRNRELHRVLAVSCPTSPSAVPMSMTTTYCANSFEGADAVINLDRHPQSQWPPHIPARACGPGANA
jgi:NAD dependent epimerase/dehydratase family enzyme